MNLAATVHSSSMPLWYATRATGVVALVLLTLSLVMGILVSVKFVSERWPRFATIGVHRNASLLTVAFLAVHILTAVLDPYAPVGLFSLVVPFVSSYRPLWLGLGTVAFDLLLALIATSLLRTRIPYRAWRAVHWAAYACWPLAIMHGLGTGTDPKSPAILALVVFCVAAVLGAGLWRLASGWPQHARARLASGLAGAMVVIAVAAWALAGPLASGWAARAGTPAKLLAQARAAGASAQNGSSAGPTASGSSALPALPLTAQITGTVNTVASGGQATVTISGSGTGSGAAPVAFKVVLSGPALDDGGVQMTSSQVGFGPAADPGRYQGRIVSLQGGDLAAALTDRAGSALSLALHIRINGGAVTGTLTASSGSTQ
ncbi:ferric reductase-like transmembrane domain-containing protein [Actinocrinis puniceicyclus]|nr:ferric reductase-like transmembrane domain-containing protein [Actinocrinis puniceicyclus]